MKLKFVIEQADDNLFIAKVYTGITFWSLLFGVGLYDTIQWCRTYQQAFDVCNEYKQTHFLKKQKRKKYPIKTYIEL